MAGPRQTNFSGGELSPLLHGRTDLPIWAKGCRTLRNFIPTKQGAAMSRPGTTFVHETKTAAELLASGVVIILQADDPGYVRLVPFNAADDESFCLEFGTNYIRFHSQGGTVDSPVGSGTPYEVATPYVQQDLEKLKWAQVGEVLTLCTPRFDPLELRHVTDAPPSWTLEAAVTEPPAPIFGDVGSVPYTHTTNFLLVDGDGSAERPALATPDTDHPAREWTWQVTQICRDNDTGELYESIPEVVTEKYEGGDFGTPEDYDTTHVPLTADSYAIFPDSGYPITLRRADAAALVPGDEGFTVVAYNIYRGRGTLFGFIGQTTSRDFVDVGDEPNFAIQPPVGTDPFGEDTEASPGAAPFDTRHLNRPAAVTYFQQRRVFAGFTLDEVLIKASSTADFDNFDERLFLHVPGESLTFTIAARRRGKIRHLIGSDRMVILTAAGSFHAGGAGQGSPWDFDSVDIRPIENIGSTDDQVLEIDGAICFIRAKGRGARALLPGGQDAGFKGFDLSRYAEHLFRGVDRTVLDWTYAEDPWGVVWACLDDGSLLSLTLDRDQEMMAWARHDMEHEDEDGNAVVHGTVHSVCAVPEGEEDGVYVAVRRTIGGYARQFVERMTSRAEYGGAVVELNGTIITPPDYICLDSAVPYIGDPAQVFTGLSHLEGTDVLVLREGMPPIGPYTGASGQIDVGAELPVNIVNTSGIPKLLAYIGARYLCDLEPLDIAGAEARLKSKRVTHVGFEVDQAKGVLVGQDFDELDDQPDREPSDGFGTRPLQTELILSPIRGASDLNARCVLRQSLPLPVTVVGLTRKVVGGDGP